MRTIARLTWLGAAFTLAVPVIAQVDQGESAERDEVEREEPFLSVPISMATVENVLNRWTDDWAGSYDFDDVQLETMRRIVKDNFIPFLRKNRGAIQDLFSEFVEVQTGIESPEIEDVADWAERALPVLDRLKDVLDGIQGQVREHLTDDQQLELNAQGAVMDVGFNMLRGKVAGWAEGGFDPETEWYPTHPPPGDRRRARDGTQLDQADENSGSQSESPATQPAAPDPKDEWTQYVVKFIERYELGRDQRDAAYLQLRKHHAERDAYLTRPRTVRDMERITELMKNAATDEEKNAAREQLARVEKRLDTIFQHLKDALNKIPTREQRARAARKAADKTPGSEKQATTQPATTHPIEQAADKKEDPGSP